MATRHFSLEELRARTFHAIETVTGASKISRERLLAIESGQTPTVAELETLADVYGLTFDDLADESVAAGDVTLALTSLEEFVDLGDSVRLRLLQAAGAVRDLVEVRALVPMPTETQEHRRASCVGMPFDAALSPTDPPHQQGAALAAAVRRHAGVGVSPLPSMRDFVREHFPEVDVLHAELGDRGPAGLTFATASAAPTIVLNLQGKNLNPLARRFSLAHELCHILVDRGHGEPLASISGYFSPTALLREQRANAFAVRLLCPETVVERLRGLRDEDAVAELRDVYGVHHRAASLYLHNLAGHPTPTRTSVGIDGPVGPDERWVVAEQPSAIATFPAALSDVPHLRRGALAAWASRAYSAGKIPRDTLARLLGVTPAHPIEDALHFLDLDLPDEGSSAVES